MYQERPPFTGTNSIVLAPANPKASTTHYPLPAPDNRKPPTNQPPATKNRKPTTGNLQLATSNQQPATGNWQLATSNKQLATANRPQPICYTVANVRPTVREGMGDRLDNRQVGIWSERNKDLWGISTGRRG